MAPRLPLEIQQYIVALTAEDGNLPPIEAPFYAQDHYCGSSRTYLSAPSSPCLSMPLICRNLRKTGEQALYATIRAKRSNILLLLETMRARSELGLLVKCVNVRLSSKLVRKVLFERSDRLLYRLVQV